MSALDIFREIKLYGDIRKFIPLKYRDTVDYDQLQKNITIIYNSDNNIFFDKLEYYGGIPDLDLPHYRMFIKGISSGYTLKIDIIDNYM